LPNTFSKMIALGLNGESEPAYEIHQSLLKGMHLIFEEGNPAGIKTVFEHLGLIEAHVRLPLVNASKELQDKIKDFLTTFQKVSA